MANSIFTQHLATMNNYSFSEKEQNEINSPRAEVFNLTKYLEIQRDIIVEATDI